VLAQVLRCNFLPEVWIPDKTTRLLRELCAHRAGLVADQTCIKNRIQSLLAQRLIPIPVRVLFNGCGRNWLSHLELSTQDRAVIDGYLKLLDQIESEEISLQKALTPTKLRQRTNPVTDDLAGSRTSWRSSLVCGPGRLETF
jgi:transposase